MTAQSGASSRLALVAELLGRLPLVIGATGHRDPRDEDIAELERRVGAVFDRIAADYLTPDGATPVVVLSALAEGADQLVARVALERGALLVAPLPMPLEDYRNDFRRGLAPNAEAEFDRLLARAIAAPELPLAVGNTIEAIRADAARRALQYREAGLFIVRHCQILISLWDGDESEIKTGGTAEIIRLQRDGIPLGSAASVRSCIDGSEIGPLIHIVTPRRKSPSEDTAIGTSPWGRALTESGAPRIAAERDVEAWRTFETWAQLTTSFNSEARRIASSNAGAAKIEQSIVDLFDDADAPSLAAKARAYAATDAPLWRAVYAVADVLAQEQQTRFRRVWAWLFTLAFLMAAALGFPANAPSDKIYALGVYQMLILFAVGLYWYARRGRFQAKFLDCRALSEATRVAIFWKILRIDRSIFDIYPICQSPELSWVKASLKSLECFDAGNDRETPALGLDETRYRMGRAFWVEGQLRYFRRRGASHQRAATRRKRWSVAFIAVAGMGTILIAFADYFGFDWRRIVPFDGADLALIAIALLPAGAAALKGHAEQLGHTAQAHQYDRMRSLYERTLRILPRSLEQLGGKAAREVFTELGREAAQENATWTAIFRLRPLRPF
jgi:hypothetical protein